MSQQRNASIGRHAATARPPSDLVVAELTRRGGTAPGNVVAGAVARAVGAVQAQRAVTFAILGGRVEQCELSGNVNGLRLRDKAAA